jgi:hypothetical protein
MSLRPTDHLNWVSSDDVTKIVAPTTGKQDAGWLADEKPSHQHFNWIMNRVDKWLRFFDKSGFDAVVGAGSGCTHATLAAALADAALTTNVTVLLRDSQTLATTIAMSKAGWRIKARPGVTLTAGVATTAIAVTAANCVIEGLRFSGFATAVSFSAAADYGRVLNCNFATCTTEVDDSSATAGRYPLQVGNLSE